jgi:rhodanese-related sulfurtransferase
MYKSIGNLSSLVAAGFLLAGCSDWTNSSIRTSSSAPRSYVAPTGRASAESDSQEVRLASVRETPTPSPAHPRVGYDEFRQLVHDRSALIIDARSPEKFAQGHIRGAINIPSTQKEAYTDKSLRGVDSNQPIVIYCGSDSCPASDIVYDYLVTQGFTNMRVFPPGWATLDSARDLH